MLKLWKQLAILTLLLVDGRAADAQATLTLPFAAGWEAQETLPWNTGAAAGQNGWQFNSSKGIAALVGTTLVNGQSVSPKAGTRMLKMETSYRGGYLRTVTPNPSVLSSSVLNAFNPDFVFVVESDFYLPSSEAGKNGAFGLCIVDNSVHQSGIARVLLNNAQCQLELEGRGKTCVPNAFPRDQWVHLQLHLDFSNQTVSAYLDGALAAADRSLPLSSTAAGDGTGNVGYAGICSLSPLADAAGKPYNPGATAPGDGCTAPQSVAFADNLAFSTSSNLPDTNNWLYAELTMDSVPDFTAAPFSLPANLPADAVIGDLVLPITFTFHSSDTGNLVLTKQEPLFSAMGDTGYITLYGVPAGTYDLGIKPTNGLQRVLHRVSVVSDDPFLPTVTLLGGNADSNTIVDFDDFLIFLNAFGSTVADSSSGFDPAADFNCDGIVNFDDFLILLNNYGQQGEP